MLCDALYDTQVPETQDDQFHERVDVGGDQDAMFHNQEDFEHLYSNDNYANNISHDDDIFGNVSYDDMHMMIWGVMLVVTTLHRMRMLMVCMTMKIILM